MSQGRAGGGEGPFRSSLNQNNSPASRQFGPRFASLLHLAHGRHANELPPQRASLSLNCAGKNVTPLFPNPLPWKRLPFGEIRPAWSKTAPFFQCSRGYIFNTLCIRLKLCISPLYKYYKIILTLHSTNSVLFACILFKLGNSDEGYQVRSKTGLLFNLRSTLTAARFVSLLFSLFAVYKDRKRTSVGRLLKGLP